MPRTAVEPGSREGRPVPRWAERLAHVVPLLVLPSGLWRLGLACGFSMGILDDHGQPVSVDGWQVWYVVGLSVFSELVALTAFGLVRPWGEVVPRRLPLIGGRTVHPLAVVAPATLGALGLVAIWTYGFRDVFSKDFLSFTNEGWAALMIGCYAPLQLWGPLLLALTWAYYRRRARPVSRRPTPAAGPSPRC